MSDNDNTENNEDKLLYCSFCGKNQNEVRKLIAGPSVYICNECIDLCNDIIKEEISEASEDEEEDFPVPMEDHLAQPWDCESREHSIIVMDRVSSSPWLCKIDGKFYTGRYMFTVDYTNSDIADDPAQHKQSHVIQLTDANQWTGNIVALPNNRVRATSPALWETGEGAPDFKPSQYSHAAEIHNSYLDPAITFNNLYKNYKNIVADFSSNEKQNLFWKTAMNVYNLNKIELKKTAI